jgi:hypothetical protein
MNWDEALAPLNNVSIGTAILSPGGTVLAKVKNFTATTAEAKEWADLFKDLQQFRQRGLSFAGKKLFVTEVSESRVTALRDHFVVFLFKVPTAIICAVCDQSTPAELAYAACVKLASEVT